MNYYTELSVELANQRDYLDQLFGVYPLAPDSVRSVDPDIWREIEDAYKGMDNIALFKALLKLKLFPVKDGFLPFFRRDKSAIERNPVTVNRICGRVRELGINKLYEKISEPKETNRQMGQLFRRWVDSGTLGFPVVGVDEFRQSDEDAILGGADAQLKAYAQAELGFSRADDKGIDFIARINKKYVIGEAKFISDEGGHQNDQFNDAMTLVETPHGEDIRTVAILDGVLYIKSGRKMFKDITGKDVNVMSALLLRDYLCKLHAER